MVEKMFAEMRTTGNDGTWRAALLGGAVVLAMYALAAALPDAAYEAVFCKLPTRLAAMYFGTVADGASFALADGRVVAVTRACGGAGFFAMLCGLLACRAAAMGGVRWLLPSVVAAWGYTVLVNGVRVVGAVWARALAEMLLPERAWAAAHLAVGVLVFFPALCIFWWGLNGFPMPTGQKEEGMYGQSDANA
jgi:hypothetical protein